jgi:hypothetical protein
MAHAAMTNLGLGADAARVNLSATWCEPEPNHSYNAMTAATRSSAIATMPPDDPSM